MFTVLLMKKTSAANGVLPPKDYIDQRLKYRNIMSAPCVCPPRNSRQLYRP